MVRSEHVRTFFHSTQSQQSKSEVCAQEFYADDALYLSSLLSDLSMFKVNHQIINDRLYSVHCTGVPQSSLSLLLAWNIYERPCHFRNASWLYIYYHIVLYLIRIFILG